MKRIRIAVAGVGNCASALLQGLTYYRTRTPEAAVGLMHWEIGGYRPGDIDIVAAYDVDARKVGQDVARAAFAEPNCTTRFQSDVPDTGVRVRMGPILDGIPPHMAAYPEARRFVAADRPPPTEDEVTEQLRRSGAQLLVNYLPVGAEEATRFYARCALRAGLGFINNIPVFIASDPEWAQRFRTAGLPLIGDDIKSQLGATITHRALMELFRHRGVQLDRTYQLNTGGNTDFLNMLSESRLLTKRVSKTEAVQAVAADRLADDSIHVGPSDYVAWQNDNKVCFIRMEGRIFGDVPVALELRLSVEDSPNSAGVAIDAIRCARLALDTAQGGTLTGPAACFCKHPPQQYGDEQAYHLTEAFIAGACRTRTRARNTVDDTGDDPQLADAPFTGASR